MIINNVGKIQSRKWGVINGENIYLFTITNKMGSFVQFTNYGAILVSAVVPDEQGTLNNVVLNYPNLAGYLSDEYYLGATIGRYANRIAGASFKLNNNRYFIDSNENGNSNHSGVSGFHAKVFEFEIEENAIIFSLLSKDGEGGFPGNLQFQVMYQWNDDNQLLISYKATTDKTTIASFTNHAYFNLSGCENILSHRLVVNATEIIELNKDFIPTGKIIQGVEKSFQMDENNNEIIFEAGGLMGLNECFVLHKNKMEPACFLLELTTGRTLEVYTSYPGLMVYTNDYFADEKVAYNANNSFPKSGIALECQYYPDSPNHIHFPSTILKEEQEYRQHILYKFGTSKNQS